MTVTGNAFSVGGSTLVVANGRVGIGMSGINNIYALNVTASNALSNILKDGLYVGAAGSSGRGVRIGYSDDGATTGYIAETHDSATAALNFVMRSNGTPVTAMTILGSGNVGIGTASPSTKVDISSGTITMAGTGAPTSGGALCLNASNQMSKCTSAIDASGDCTCP